ncbi:MAG: DUF6599 family protein [Candidatus Latescibacterota bacterium]
MKRGMLYILSILLAGCAAAGSGGIQGVFRNLGDFQIEVRDMTDAINIEKLAPEFGTFFVEFGVDSCLTADFRENGRSYSVQMITFLTAKGARGAYDFSRPREGEVIPVEDQGVRTGSDLRFVKGNYLVAVSPGSGADMTSALAFAKMLSKRIPGSTFPPELYTPLPKDGLIKGTEFYFMGPKAFASRFSPELAEAFSIGEAIEGVAATYTLVGGGEATLAKIRFTGRTQTVQIVYDFIQGREKTPMIRPSQNRDYYTIFNSDNTEVYVAEFADWLLIIPDGPKGGKAQQLLEYALRSI